jgi:probable F420-dependent oxidoreductase
MRWAVRLRGAASGPAWIEKVRAVEALGYDTVVLPDHVASDPSIGWQFAPMPALMAAADATTRLRVSALVLANDYRNPVMLAKEITTIDAISGGRIDLGLGAGWFAADYAALGQRLDAPQVRMERLEEALVLLRKLFTQEHVDHDGRHYRVRDVTVLPRPTQKPYPPILVGGRGPRMLELAARHADIVSIDLPSQPSSARHIDSHWLASRIERIRHAAGERFGAVTLHLMCEMKLTPNAAAAYADAASRLGLPIEDVRASPLFIYGGIDTIAERVAELRSVYGIGYLRVTEDQMTDLARLIPSGLGG